MRASSTEGPANDIAFSVPSLGTGLTIEDHFDGEYWPPDRVTTQIPFLSLPGTNSFIDTGLPLIVDADFHGTGTRTTMQQPDPPQPPMYDLLTSQHDLNSIHNNLWPPYISEVSLIPWVDVFFDRLHTTLPVLNRSSIFTRIFLQEHRRNALFGSMILSLCAFAITQPILINERSTSSTRASQAKKLMDEATKLRSSSDFGENPDLEAILTSFFLFGCLFGSNQHNAAWLRLREAIDLAMTMGLNNQDSYRFLSSEEKSQRMRVYLVLYVTERWV